MKAKAPTATEKPLRVLLVDDDPINARLVRGMLAQARGAPFEVERADRLALGLEMVRAGSFDVVLLDLLLPDSFGTDTVAKFARSSRGVPIVVLSGVDDASLMRDALNHGAHDFLLKGTLQAETLVRCLRYVTVGAPGAAEENDPLGGLLENGRGAIVAVRADGAVVYANPSAARLLGRPIYQIIGERFPLGGSGSSAATEIPLPSGGRVSVHVLAMETEWDGRPARLLFLRDAAA